MTAQVCPKGAVVRSFVPFTVLTGRSEKPSKFLASPPSEGQAIDRYDELSDAPADLQQRLTGCSGVSVFVLSSVHGKFVGAWAAVIKHQDRLRIVRFDGWRLGSHKPRAYRMLEALAARGRELGCRELVWEIDRRECNSRTTLATRFGFTRDPDTCTWRKQLAD